MDRILKSKNQIVEAGIASKMRPKSLDNSIKKRNAKKASKREGWGKNSTGEDFRPACRGGLPWKTPPSVSVVK